MWAFEALGFDQYSHLMKIYLQRYKEVMKMDKTSGTHYDAADMAAAMGYPAEQITEQFDPTLHQ